MATHAQVGEIVAKKKVSTAVIIFVAMLLGIIVGYMIFKSYPDKKVAAEIAGALVIAALTVPSLNRFRPGWPGELVERRAVAHAVRHGGMKAFTVVHLRLL